MSITTRAELITAIQTWAVRPDFGAATVDDYITLTEAIFNNGDGALGSGDYIAPLRCREMITTGTVIPITAGTGTLPTDFNEAIRATTSLKTLIYVPPDWYTENYPTGQSGESAFYSVLGSTLYCGSDVTLDYYAKIPALLTTDPNWLLSKAPNAYLHGGLYFLYLYDKAGDTASIHRQLLGSAIAGLQNADRTSIIVSPQRRASMVAW
jgi:hypothetical protein